MEISKKQVPFTGQELSQAIDFLQDKETISMSGLQRKFDKSYNWAMCVMETLQELYIVEEFQGKRDRVVIKPES